MLHVDPRRIRPEKAAWAPIEWGALGEVNSQWRAMQIAHVNDMLLAGGRGGGKTETQLMRFRRLVGKGYGSFWRGIIFDREYKNLDDLVVKSKRLFRFADGPKATFLASASAFKWVWETGEELLFRVVKSEDDYWNFHGHEYPFVGWNELTKYATPKLYNRMRSVNRSGFDPEEHTPRILDHKTSIDWKLPIGAYRTIDGLPLPPIPLEVCSTTNPYGPGHNWVKAQFIDVAPYCRVVTIKAVVFNPKTRVDEEVTRTQITLFSTFKDNPYLSTEYVAGLFEETDANVLKAWTEGDWDIVAGGAFDDVWRRGVHILPRFAIPAGWYIDRTMDWGSSHPLSVGWWAEANGEEAVYTDSRGNRVVFCPPRGTLVLISELYFTRKIGSNEGLKLSATDVALRVKQHEIEMMEQRWIAKQPSAGPADNQIRDVREIDVETIEAKMAKQGVRWTESDKSPGSRRNGLELARDRLSASIKGEEPGLYFMDNCTATIGILPTLPRDDDNMDDIDTTTEDHVWDMTRYRVLKSSIRYAKVVNVNFGNR